MRIGRCRAFQFGRAAAGYDMPAPLPLGSGARAGAAGRAWPTGKWYLSFDCATKTFAFSLCWVDLAGWAAASAAARRRLGAAQELVRRAACAAGPGAAAAVAAAAEAVAALDAETRAYLRLADGEVVDLAPGQLDAEIPTVERVRAVVRYVARRVRPALVAAGAADGPLRVVVEYQMGQNAPARTVSVALVTLFAEFDVTYVAPALKNMVYTCEAGRYYAFAERYRRGYDANKAHAAFNLTHLEEKFASTIPPCPLPLRGHIADSVLQVLGLLVYGPSEAAAPSHF